jgi:hypothetical protein
MQEENRSNLYESDFDENALHQIEERFRELLESGVSEQLGEAIPTALREAAGPIAETLRATGYRMILEHGAFRQEFEARLLMRWLEPLSLYEMFLVAAREAGEDFNLLEHPSGEEQDLWVGTALRLLHGRGCLVASEVLELLRHGYVSGADARWRTLHEIAVLSAILGEHPQLAERYLLHASIQSARDADEYEVRVERLGYQPLTEEEASELRREKKDLLARNPNGWVVPLFKNNSNPKFRDLEEVAGLDHLRSHYRLASHHLHGGAKGDSLNVIERGPESAILTGPTNNGLGAPGHQALISLYQATVSLLLHGRPSVATEPIRLVVLHALEELLDEAGEAFARVQDDLDNEEAALWQQGDEPEIPSD